MPAQLRIVFASSAAVKTPKPRSLLVLTIDNWDDFSFKTMFSLTVYDEVGELVECGSLKIGFKGQGKGRTSEHLELPAETLPDGYFSLGQDVEYYKNIRDKLSHSFGNLVLVALRDVVYNPNLFDEVSKEDVFDTSLTRDIKFSSITGQFKRVLDGGIPLTEFNFSYRDPGSPTTAKVKLSFEVVPESTPPTNVHILIGRNGVGKTTLLNNMTRAIVLKGTADAGPGRFYANEFFGEEDIPDDFFSSVVSVSFSAFDPFKPLEDKPNRNDGVAYFYVGMKKTSSVVESVTLKSHNNLCRDFIESLVACFSVDAKKTRWVAAIKRLESDDNFADMDLASLAKIDNTEDVRLKARKLFVLMSSGHAIVLLTMTRLVETVDEKTLVLMDEPESHLHPPLLSAFTRAISDLLTNRNGVAIVATHSPVVAQEVPQACVWTIERSRTTARIERPQIETFGENVGVLTQEIFGLEVTRSGFHDMLRQAVERGKSFNEILDEYHGQLGFEAQALVRGMISSHANTAQQEEDF
ncbi:putative ATPase [Acidovorax soli]|uniref:Putative ATPase n=1 Tax=Acidovorax soli TaxID=592050 RepID=A0A7X0PD13_9BURK|nr:AAA family ATPase [Acidovorax soli]MBB6559571.1 putative ATPase [Acidovorax soli]